MLDLRLETCLPREDIERIWDSPAIQSLEGAPRYHVFIEPGTTTEEWIAGLDCDYDNRFHLAKTACLAQGIALTEGAPKEVTYRAVLTALVHDAAESILGDVNFHDKTDDDEEEEIALLDQLVETGDLRVTPQELQIASATMRDKKNGPTTFEGKIFDLSEYYGYFLSAQTAWDSYEAKRFRADQHKVIDILGVTVTAHHLLVLLEYEKQGFRSPNVILEGRKDAIDRVFDHGNNSDVIGRMHAMYERQKAPHTGVKLEAKYYQAEREWRNRYARSLGRSA